MDNPDSDDYELMPSHELDDLRREVSSLKKNSMVEGDKARMLIESMDRMTISINRLITILNDAQKDIIDEYQESKPAEKLNQLLEQNETIAKALLLMNEKLEGNSPSRASMPIPITSYPPSANYSQSAQNNSPPQQNYSQPQQSYSVPSPYGNAPSGNISSMPQQNTGSMNIPRSILSPINPSPTNTQFANQQQMQFDNSMSMNPGSMPPIDDFPPMGDIPPLDNPAPSAPKKKFLGIM